MPQPSLISRESENAADTDRSIVKIAAVVASAVIFSLAFGHFLNQLNFVYSLIAVIFFLSILTLQAFFIKDWGTILMAVFLETAAIALPFYKIISISLIVAFFIFFLMLLFVVISGRRELKNALQIPFFKVAKAILVNSIIFVILLVSSIFIFSGIGGKLLTEENLQAFVNPVITPIIKSFIPDFSPEASVGNLLAELIKTQMQESDQFKALSESAKNDYLNKAIDQEAKTIEKMLGMSLDVKKSLSENIHMVLVSLLNNLSPQDKNYFGIALLILIWLTAGSVALIVYIPVVVLTYIIYEILLATNFVVIQYESRSREIIILK